MKLTAYAAIAAVLLTSAVVLPARADHHKPATAALKCPSCGMMMPTRKSAAMSVPIYITAKKTVYYCCPQCPSGQKAAAYWKKHHKPMPV
jgi:uncharacterized protein with PIN domain